MRPATLGRHTVYTVARFLLEDRDPSAWTPLLEELRAALPEASVELRARGRRDGVAVELCRSDDGAAHLAAALDFLRRSRRSIERAAAEGVSVGIDMAIEPEDRRRRPYVSVAFPPELLLEAGRLGVGLETTHY